MFTTRLTVQAARSSTSISTSLRLNAASLRSFTSTTPVGSDQYDVVIIGTYIRTSKTIVSSVPCSVGERSKRALRGKKKNPVSHHIASHRISHMDSLYHNYRRWPGRIRRGHQSRSVGIKDGLCRNARPLGRHVPQRGVHSQQGTLAEQSPLQRRAQSLFRTRHYHGQRQDGCG